LFRNQTVILGWMDLKGWGGKMKNREEWRQIFQEAKAY
jgi:hypothetical protein